MYRELAYRRRRAGAALRDLWDGIRSRPGRIGLSVLAIAIGVAALTVLIAVLGGLREKSRRLVEELGVNVIGIVQQREAGVAAAGLEQRHASLLAANLAGSAVTTLRLYAVPTLGTGELLSVLATDDSFIRVRQWKLLEGRFLDRWDIERAERNAVVSDALRKAWGWKVGSIVLLKDLPFTVVGVVAAGGGALDTEWSEPKLALGERAVLVPRTVAPLWVIDYGESPGPAVDAIFIRAAASAGVAGTLSKAQRLLVQPDSKLRDLSWITPESLTQRLESVRTSIGWAAGSVAALCLILGGTTLMSLMITNVRERVTEIGLRRALGASRRDIALLFILEACAVSGAAAGVASAAAHLALALFGRRLPFPVELGTTSLLAPVALAIVLALVFSYWPARFAAGIMPSEALRNE